MGKRVAGLSEARDIVEQGTEGGMVRENMELRKLMMKLSYVVLVLKLMSKPVLY